VKGAQKGGRKRRRWEGGSKTQDTRKKARSDVFLAESKARKGGGERWSAPLLVSEKRRRPAKQRNRQKRRGKKAKAER